MIDVLEDCIYIDQRALWHSTAKLGKRDFVFKFEDRIEDSTQWYYLYGRGETLVNHDRSRFCNFKFASKI